MIHEIEELSLALQEHLEDCTLIDEGLFSEVFDELAECLLDRNRLANPTVGEERAFASMRAPFLSESYVEKGSRESFGIGALWGAVEVRDACVKILAAREKEAERTIAVELHHGLFNAVMRQPGITHAALAKSYGKSVSRLTQIISSFDGLDLLSTMRVGRSKHYYLTQSAKDRLSGMVGVTNSMVGAETGRGSLFSDSQIINNTYTHSVEQVGSAERTNQLPIIDIAPYFGARDNRACTFVNEVTIG